ncbi:MAG: C25 family cysteine peptidase [Calditrichota bacterium]
MAHHSGKILVILSLALLIGSGFAALSRPSSARKSTSRPAESILDRVQFDLLQYSEEEFIFEWECPEPTVERDNPQSPITGICISGAETHHQTGVPRLPKLTQLFECLPGRVSVQIVSADIETRAWGEMAPTPEDIMVDPPAEAVEGNSSNTLDASTPPLSLAERQALTPLIEGLWPPQMVSVQEAGIYRGHRLNSLHFFPVQVDAPAGIARFARRIRIRVTLPHDRSAVESRKLDRSEETAALRQMLGPLSFTAQPTRMTEAFTGRGGEHRPLDETVGGRWKIVVNTPGIIRLTAEDLRFVGCPVDQITTFDTHIHNRGREIPIYFSGEADGRFDDHDYIDFYGIPNQETHSSITPSFYQDYWTKENVYWLSWGDGHWGLRLGDEDGSWKTGPLWGTNRVRTQTSIRTTMHFESDSKFDRLSESTSRWYEFMQLYGPHEVREDHWFWGEDIEALTTRDFPISLPFPNTRSPSAVGVRAALQGFSSGPASDYSGYHRVAISVNGVSSPGLTVGKVTINDNNTAWDSQTPIIVQAIPPSDTISVGIRCSNLSELSNYASVTVTGDGLAGTRDRVYANWFEVEYERELRTRDHFFLFRFDTTRGDTFSYDIRGFSNSNVAAWKLGQSRLTSLDVRGVSLADEGSSYAARFQLISDGAYDILVFDNSYPQPPAAILPEMSTRNMRTMSGAEYLIIYHDQFAADPSLLRMDSLRRVTFSGSVDTFRISEVYEQFSDGITNPMAIHRFLKYAYENWPIRPTHVCLIGDGIVDNRQRNQSGNLISSLYVPTPQYGIAASDVLFGCVSGPPSDVIPDIAIGRISCRSVTELESYVERLIRYENPATSDYNSPFHSRFLFVADKRDGQFNFDRNFSEVITFQLPEHINVSRVYVDSLNPGQAQTALRDAFRNGAVVVNYNGHGGGGQWSSATLMDVSKVSLLNNARAYPFITNFTCYVGAFDDRNQSAVLGEAFLFARNSRLDPVGGIGVYSSTSVGWAYTGVDMQQQLFNFIAEPPGMTLGQIVQQNKTRFWGSIPFPSPSSPIFAMMMTMTLLGDPGVRLALPQQLWNDFEADTNLVSEGDTIYVSGTLPWDPQGSVTDVYALPYNGSFTTTETEYAYINGQAVQVTRQTLRNLTPAFNTTLIIPQPVRTQSFDSIMVRIPTSTAYNFVSAAGHILLYAVNPGNGDTPPLDAVGWLPLYQADSLSGLYMFDRGLDPANFIRNDSLFRIYTVLNHREGIQRVRARGIFRPAQGPVVLDTVEMTQTIPGRWITPDLGPYTVYGGSYRVQFFAHLNTGEVVATAEDSLRVESRTDYSIYQVGVIYPTLEPGAQPLIRIPVINSSSTYARRPEALLIRVTGVRDTTYFDSTLSRQVTVPADSFARYAVVHNLDEQPPLIPVFVPAPLQPGQCRVTVMIDPDSAVAEVNENNNQYTKIFTTTPLLPATNLIGSYLPRAIPQTNAFHRYWKDGVKDTIRAQLYPGSLSMDSTTLIYSSDSVAQAAMARLTSSGLNPPLTGQTVRTYRVTLGDSTEQLTADGHARVSKNFSGLLDSTDIAGLYLFVKQSGANSWWKLRNQTLDYARRDTTYPPSGGIQIRWSGRISGDAYSLGTFAIFRLNDSRGPDIAFNANGLRFTRHSILPRQPEIYANLADLNGIDRSPGKFYFILDNDTIPESRITWSDTSSWGDNVSAMIRPDLLPGSHTIRVKATDNIGNSDSLTAEFEVRGQFGFEWAINYPNPFSRSTVIAFTLTDVTDDFVEVKIFTVSGRHIRTLYERERYVTNYRQISWNGLDSYGEEVANGVYFARLRAKQGDQEVEKIIKLAKVR